MRTCPVPAFRPALFDSRHAPAVRGAGGVGVVGGVGVIVGGLALALAAAATAAAQPQPPGPLARSYFLTMVARTGGEDRCVGVPPLCTMTDSDPAIDRSGSVVVRFQNSATGGDGLFLFDGPGGAGRVIVTNAGERFSRHAIGMAGGRIVAGRLDSGVEVYDRSGQPTTVLVPAGPLVAPEWLTISRAGVVAGTRRQGAAEAAGHVVRRPLFGDGDRRSLLAEASAIGPFYTLGPCVISGGGMVASAALTDEGDSVVVWPGGIPGSGSDPEASVVFSTTAWPEYLAVAQPIGIADEGEGTAGAGAAVALHALHGSDGWSVLRVDEHGVSVIASAAQPVPGGSLRPGTLAARAPAINAQGSVAFWAENDSGSAVYAGPGGRAPQLVAGYDTQVATATGTIRLGQGSGDRRQVIVSRVAINDRGQITFVARLRDGTTGLIIATPAQVGCSADFTGDGRLDPDDLADYITAYFAGEQSWRTDVNGDEQTDPDDLADYIRAYFEGCGGE